MTAQQTPLLFSSKHLAASQLNQLFKMLKRLQFNGQLVLKATNGQQWFFYLHLGWVMYVTGGIHPVRRWKRNLAIFCPWILSDISEQQVEFPGIDQDNFTTCWEEHLLSIWVAQQKITRDQAATMTQAVIAEVLFDIAQAKYLTYQIKKDNLLSTQLILIDPEVVIAKVNSIIQVWQEAKLTDYSPNQVPVINEKEQLEKCLSASVYQAFKQLLNGQRTLRDLALQMKRDIVQVTKSLLPYIQSGCVKFISIPDLPTPVKASSPKIPSTQKSQKPIIACVDDSPLVCQTMSKLLISAGYQFFSVTDDMRAMAMLLTRKPDLVFLDLVMPNTNGYEICSQLRKLSIFRDTPIVILTGNDGIVDQVRARLVGASDFLSKPIDPEIVLGTITKYLVPSKLYQ